MTTSTIKSKEDATYVVPADALIPLIDNTGTIKKSVNPSQLVAAGASDIVLDKAAAKTKTPALGVTLYITSDDGKGNMWQGVAGAAIGTYVEDGGTYCGTIILPTGGDGSSAWVRDSNAEMLNVRWFGAVGDGAVDDTAAVQAAINAAVISLLANKLVLVPTGEYLVGEIDLNPLVSIHGTDRFRTIFIPNADSITIFSLENTVAILELKDFAISCKNRVGVTGIHGKFTNFFHILNIEFKGCKTNFILDQGGWNKVLNCISSGSSNNGFGSGNFWVGSTDQTKYGNVFSVIENYTFSVDAALQTADALCTFHRAVAMKIPRLIGSSITDSDTCILVEDDCQGLIFTGCSAVGFDLGLVLQTGGGAGATLPIFNSFTNFEFDQCETNSILIHEGRNNRFIGCAITSSAIATDTTAVSLEDGSDSNKFHDCHVAGYYTAPTGTGWLFTGAVNNVLNGCTVSGSFQGIAATGATHIDCKIMNCDFAENMTVGGTGIAGDWSNNGHYFSNLAGDIEINETVTQPAMPASGVAKSNPYPVPVMISLIGGTTTAVTLQTQSGAARVLSIASPCTITLQPSETIAITYSSAPTWDWIGALTMI